MTCELSPYSCMPNTMSIGAMGTVLGRYPDLLYAPLEIKGDAEVHALSRCQMILTEAKKRAQREYEETLEKTGLSQVELRAAVDPAVVIRCGEPAQFVLVGHLARNVAQRMAHAPVRPAQQRLQRAHGPVLQARVVGNAVVVLEFLARQA